MTNPTVDCVQCKHYYVTWDKDFPKGCKLFGFKSKNAPSYLVYEATGAPCEHCEEKRKRNAGPTK